MIESIALCGSISLVKRGKLLWFDAIRHEGLVLTDDGRAVFVHSTAFVEGAHDIQKAEGSHNLPCLYTLYESASNVQVNDILLLREQV